MAAAPREPRSNSPSRGYEKPCPACDKRREPVCATSSSGDKKTFFNDCLVGYFNCEDGTGERWLSSPGWLPTVQLGVAVQPSPGLASTPRALPEGPRRTKERRFHAEIDTKWIVTESCASVSDYEKTADGECAEDPLQYAYDENEAFDPVEVAME